MKCYKLKQIFIIVFSRNEKVNDKIIIGSLIKN